MAPLNFTFYTLNGMELLHNLHHCSQTLMYTIHTCYTPALAVSGTSWASWCVHFSPLSVCCWRLSISLRHGQISVEEGEEWVRNGRSTLALVRQNIVQALFTYAEAVKQQIIHSKHCKNWWQSSMLCVKHSLVRGSEESNNEIKDNFSWLKYWFCLQRLPQGISWR